MSRLLAIPASSIAVCHRHPVPVHVIGHGRSGTSVFIRLMRKYLRIAFGTESQFIIRFQHRFEDYGDLSVDDNLRRLVAHIHRERWFVRCYKRFGFTTSVEAILADVTERTYRGVLDAVFLQLQKFLEMPRWGDKTPEYLHYLPTLHGLFPEAKYIHVVRDGRDVALSGFKQRFGEQNVFMAACAWTHAVRLAHEFGQVLPEDQFLELHYEKFVSRPTEQFARLIEFLEIDDSDGAVLDHIDAHVREDLMQGNFGKWRTRLTRPQIERFDRIACRWLHEYGYECTVEQETPPAFLPSLYWRCDSKLRKLLRADYWSDNLYKARLRSRELID